MTKQKLIKAVVAFHRLWKARPQKDRKGGLKMALLRERRELFKELRKSPALMRELPAETLGDWLPQKSNPPGDRTLEALMPQILELYISRLDRTVTFVEFVNRLKTEHSTARSLREYLKRTLKQT